MKKIILITIALMIMASCSSKKNKIEATNYTDNKNNLMSLFEINKQESEYIKKMSPDMKPVKYPFIDRVKHKEFFDAYFKQKFDRNHLMAEENMNNVLHFYEKDLVKKENAFLDYKRKHCGEKIPNEKIILNFSNKIGNNYIIENKTLVMDAILAVYFMNEKKCVHGLHEIYQRAMLENLTLLTSLTDDLIKFFDSFQGEKSPSLIEDFQGILALRMVTSKYFNLIIPHRLYDYFLEPYKTQLNPKVITFLNNEFKGKPFRPEPLIEFIRDL